MAQPQEQSDTSLDVQGATEKLKGLFNPPEEPTKSPEQSGETDAEVTASEADQTADTTAEDAEAETQAEVETIGADQLAELLKFKTEGIVVKDDGEIRFRVKVDGEESDAPLSDLIERYQRDAHLTNRSKELAELRKQADSQLSDLVGKGQQMAQQVNAIYEAMSKEALSRFDDIDWKTLRVEDPAEYAARKAEMADIANRLTNTRDGVINNIAQQMQAAQNQIREKMQVYLAEQRDALKTMIPNWSPEVQKDIKHFLNTQGFVDSEVNNIFDARMVAIAHQAMLYNKGKAELKGKLATKKLPKVLKPGAKPDANALASESVRKAAAKLKKSGSLDDAVSVLKHRFRKE